ncbi:MAG: DNA-3-methyladenine glycosylase family protein [Acidimicrobiales bacterium]
MASRAKAPGYDAAVAVEHLRASDAVLRKAIDRIGPFGLQLQNTPSTFGALAEAIVYQQLSPRAAATIFGRLCALFPDDPYLRPEQILDTADESIRAAGISGAKLFALRDLARRTEEGTVPTIRQARHIEDEELIERLVSVRGIGRWTAQMFLIFRLGRPDVLPVDDYGLRRGFATAFRLKELPSKQEVAARGERWGPYRSAASWYLWRVAEEAPPA